MTEGVGSGEWLGPGEKKTFGFRCIYIYLFETSSGAVSAHQ